MRSEKHTASMLADFLDLGQANCISGSLLCRLYGVGSVAARTASELDIDEVCSEVPATHELPRCIMKRCKVSLSLSLIIELSLFRRHLRSAVVGSTRAWPQLLSPGRCISMCFS